jgi:ribonuclease-3
VLRAFKFFLPSFSKNKFLRSRVKAILGTTPRNIRLYEIALIHKSASIVLPNGKIVNNERLEYLGDAVLDTVVADFLFNIYPNKNEGFLSQMRSKIVKRKNLNTLAIQMGIPELLVSNTESQISKHIYGDALEALVGALYLDKGYNASLKCVKNNVISKYLSVEQLESTETDFKSRLIEWAQKHKQEISFQTHVECSESDNQPSFIATVNLSDQVLGSGRGSSKKEAEQNAAEDAYNTIEQLPNIT